LKAKITFCLPSALSEEKGIKCAFSESIIKHYGYLQKIFLTVNEVRIFLW